MDDLITLLEDLAQVVADQPVGPHSRCALAAVVGDLETIAGIVPGPHRDAPVVLARRFARAHRALIHAESLPPGVLDRVDRHVATLRDPAGALLSAWNHWQDLRSDDTSFPERLAAEAGLALARRAVCRQA